MTDSIGLIRIMGILMGVFGGVAFALSAIGVYGVLSESVAQRTAKLAFESRWMQAARGVGSSFSATR